jgi:hypothetical protein
VDKLRAHGVVRIDEKATSEWLAGTVGGGAKKKSSRR